jgi:drug/metabolite transporter (DMT)-like permease
MKGIFLVIAACALWAIDTLIRYPLLGYGISAERIVFSEHLILTLVFIPVMISSWRKIWNAKVAHIFYFALIGGLGSAVSTLCFTKAFTIINPSLVILLQKLQPIVAIVLARIILKEPIYKTFLFWALLCLIGGVLVSYQQLFPGMAQLDFSMSLLDKTYLYGYVLTLTAVIGWGSSTVFGKKLSLEGYQPKEIMAGRFSTGFLCLIPLFLSGAMNFDFSMAIWGQIAMMVALSGLLAMFLYYKGLSIIPARLCALTEMFFPFCAVAINWIFLNKSLDLIQIVGGALLLLGSTVIQAKRY